MIYKVIINGTDQSPFPARWGMEINPFPQIAKAEHNAAERRLAECGRRGTTPQRIRELLADFDEQFVELVADNWVAGKIVRLEIDMGEVFD